ncbi:MAG: 4'-phosphopantetheinyl transferase superfamily protein [Akkermansia sp.]|nr:4'-phosphopantetheinyl transferase superfamily protein [Akkermansia sp.]
MDYLCYRLSELPPHAADLNLLPPVEQQQYAQRPYSSLVARCLLRQELARRLHRTLSDIELTTNAHGKPSLLHNELHFNLSHSGDLLCMAFHHAPVGVDIQQLRPRTATQRLAERMMCRQQLSRWLDGGADVGEFFACWCAAEALVKHAGATVWQAREFPFLYRHGRIEPLFTGAPVVKLFSPAAGYCGAVAVERRDSE